MADSPTVTAIKAALDRQADAVELFTKRQTERLDEFGERIESLETRASSPSAGARKAASAEVKAFEDFIRTGTTKGLEAPSTKEMSIVGGAADGGAMVPEVIANQIISRAIARSPILGVLRDTLATTSDYVRLVNLRGATAAWSDETSTRTATNTPMLREVRPTHGELYALPAVTNWLLQDSQFNVERFLSENVSDTFAKSLEAAVLYGDGTSKPTGILDGTPVVTADGNSPERSADVIQYVAATSDLADDLISLYFKLKPEYRRNAVFVMSSATLATVRKLRDSNGSGYLWQANLGGGVDAGDGTLLGKRVITSEELPVLGNSPVSDAILCGDFMAGYEMVRIGGMAVIRDNVTVPGKTKFYTAARFGGRLTDNDAIKVLRG
jgi:HK97 family phage major capsid protein